ncbi:PP2C family protein-serine/threonine phosphatase [Actinomycetospora lemnae]|uniref:PP2C family protein-serine/threonine phosphatase n=1 Tax=Actinomycetospora lemnae TaxID=3019891 RepID=A0ABT5SWG5_9PSEU|nr:PP2C family protein-serine/threonine phosphatase [Actinomycetospora sp. DW7H6]MDD7967197.1 PP2C family protein-serine/threonine phosphatase [Actinomycetospora sp. DW7H6]
MEGRHGAPTREASAARTTEASPAAPGATPTAPEGGPGLLDGLEEGVVVCDRAGVVRAANPAARALLPQLRVGEIVDVARCEVLSRAVHDRDAPASFETVVVHPDGEHHLRGRRGPVLGPVPPPPPEPRDGDTAWYLRDVTGEHARTDTLLAAQERAAFLAEAGRALHGVLHLDRTARRVVALAVPRLAAGATLVVRHDDTVTWACAELGGGRPRLGHAGTGGLARVPRLAAALTGEGAGTGDPFLAGDLTTLTGLEAPAGDVRTLAVPTTGVVDALVVLAGPRSTGSDSRSDSGSDSVDPLVLAEEEVLTSYVARAGAALAAAALHEEQAHLGAVLQESLAAPRLPATAGIAWGAAYRPARETMRVGGDFYEVVDGSERSAFLLGDVCGKGIEAAVLSGRVRQSWHALRLLEDRPGRLLPLLNTALLDAVATRDESPRFATMVLGDARPLADGTVALRLATGGHPPPLVLRANGDVEAVPVSGMLVGGLREARFGEAEVLLAPGDTCLLYSDGVVEARGPGDFFGEERLADALPRCAGAPAAVLCEHLEQTVVSWLDGHDHDDIAMLAVQAPRHAAEAPQRSEA